MHPRQGRGTALVIVMLTAALATDGCHPSPKVSAPISGSACVARSSLSHADLRNGVAVWVRFCPGRGPDVDPAVGLALIPAGVLTRGADQLVTPWQHSMGDHVEFGCGVDAVAAAYRVQIGFADGTVGEIDADTGGCPAQVGAVQLQNPYLVYAALVTALGRQNVPASPVPVTGPFPCPPTPVAASPSGAPWTSETGMVLDHTPILGQLCRYIDGHLASHDALTAKRAEDLRVAVDGGVGVTPGSAGSTTRRHLREFAVDLAGPSRDAATFWVLGRAAHVYVATAGGLRPLGDAGAQLTSAILAVSG